MATVDTSSCSLSVNVHTLLDLHQLTGGCCGSKQSPFVVLEVKGQKIDLPAVIQKGRDAEYRREPSTFFLKDLDNLSGIDLRVSVKIQASPTALLIGTNTTALEDLALDEPHRLSIHLKHPELGSTGTVNLTLRITPPLMPALLDGKYKPIKVLGKGNFGCAIMAKSIVDDQDYALKSIKCPEDSALAEIKGEAKILFPLAHPNIVRYFSAFLYDDFERTRNFCMVMEMCSGGTLQDRMVERRESGTPFNEGQIGLWTYELASALAYLHSKDVLHRDLKMDNVFMVENSTKLADFGLAAVTSATRGQAGALPYESPEQANGNPYDGRNDVWALGCVLSELLTLKQITERVSTSSTVFAMDFPAVRSTIAECQSIHRYLGGLVARLLHFQALERPTAAQVVEELTPVLPTFRSKLPAGLPKRRVSTTLDTPTPMDARAPPSHVAYTGGPQPPRPVLLPATSGGVPGGAAAGAGAGAGAGGVGYGVPVAAAPPTVMHAPVVAGGYGAPQGAPVYHHTAPIATPNPAHGYAAPGGPGVPMMAPRGAPQPVLYAAHSGYGQPQYHPVPAPMPGYAPVAAPPRGYYQHTGAPYGASYVGSGAPPAEGAPAGAPVTVSGSSAGGSAGPGGAISPSAVGIATASAPSTTSIPTSAPGSSAPAPAPTPTPTPGPGSGAGGY